MLLALTQQFCSYTAPEKGAKMGMKMKSYYYSNNYQKKLDHNH